MHGHPTIIHWRKLCCSCQTDTWRGMWLQRTQSRTLANMNTRASACTTENSDKNVAKHITKLLENVVRVLYWLWEQQHDTIERSYLLCYRKYRNPMRCSVMHTVYRTGGRQSRLSCIVVVSAARRCAQVLLSYIHHCTWATDHGTTEEYISAGKECFSPPRAKRSS